MSDSPELAISGVAGRMGRAIAKAALERGFTLAGAAEAPGSPHVGASAPALAGHGLGEPLVVTDPVAAATGAKVWIDFTTPAATVSALDALRHTSVTGVVIGTTGFSAEELGVIDRAAADFAIVKAGNYSLGVAMLCALVEAAAGTLGPDWDIEIAETHHRKKADAPSGTALMLGEAAAAGRRKPLEALKTGPYEGREARRPDGAIGFSVRRAGGVIGEHEALFGAEKELLRLSHTALDRSVFADGALQAADWVSRQEPGLYSMNDVLGLLRG